MDDPSGTPSCPHAAIRADAGHRRPRPDDEALRLRLVAYERGAPAEGALFRLPSRRGWMDRSHNRFAYRCLPLVAANQAGWLVRNPVTFSVMWTGGMGADGLQILMPEGQVGWAGVPPETIVESHFGEAILTFQLPFLFRTSDGYNLWVKGPANVFKDGVQPLEAIVETDWSHSPFTMNWRLTRPYQSVTFHEGEPICQLVPYPRGLIERFDPEIRPIATDPGLAAAFAGWHEGRGQFLQDRVVPGTEAQRRDWQKDYFQGRLPEGGRHAEHQTSLEVKEFVRVAPVADADPSTRPA